MFKKNVRHLSVREYGPIAVQMLITVGSGFICKASDK